MPEQQIEMFSEEPPAEKYPVSAMVGVQQGLKLKSLHVSHFKGCEDINIQIPQLALLTGPNNSGKSTILQAIIVGFECFRRCVDMDKWRLREHGRSLKEFDFLPVNEPTDLWFEKVWKPTKGTERQITIGFDFESGVSLTFAIRYLFGFLNVRVLQKSEHIDENVL